MLSGAQGGSQGVKNGQINPNSWVAERCRSQVVGKGLVLPRLLWDASDPRRRRGLFVPQVTPRCFPSAAVDFFNQINMLYGTITEFCTESSCPVMSAGPR